MKIDPYKCKERFEKWKENSQKEAGVSKENLEIIKRFLSDMEIGLNISGVSKKGSRGYVRLLVLKNRLIMLSKKFQGFLAVIDMTKLTEEQAHSFFSALRSGKVKKKDGKEYKDVTSLVKDFKTFWHWYMKFSKKNGKEIVDITADLDTRGEKPKWVYLDEEQIRKLTNQAKYEYKVLIWFLFDSGIRAPTELINVRVSDFYKDFTELNIRDEISKTFGRRINLMLCSELIKQYVKDKGLRGNDQVFDISPPVANRYLKRLGEKMFGDKESLAGERYSKLSLYDFRHNSCCYWLQRYKHENGLKYRFGWKKSDKIYYYSELLGMNDTISEEDMIVDVTKTEMDKRLAKNEKELKIVKEQLRAIQELVTQLGEGTKE